MGDADDRDDDFYRLTLLYIGIVAEYIRQIHGEVKNRTGYVIRRDLAQLQPGDHSQTEGNEKTSSGKER